MVFLVYNEWQMDNRISKRCFFGKITIMLKLKKAASKIRGSLQVLEIW